MAENSVSSATATVILGSVDNAFAHGGNRLCFYHPEDPRKIVKVLRRDKQPWQKRLSQPFPKTLKPLSSFNDNLQELKVYQQIDKKVGPEAYELIPHCYGLVDTDHGPGLVSELIVDGDDKVSLTLKQFLWQFGKTQPLLAALDHFSKRWAELCMPSRNLLLHNVVVQQQDEADYRLVVIDGLGWPGAVSLASISTIAARRQAQRKVARLANTIEQLLRRQAEGADWGVHGWLEEQDRLLPGTPLSTDNIKRS